MKKSYRYPGAQSFSTFQKNIFFGRETEIRDILRLIRLEKYLVIYGKSGMGKTSLLSAGLVPLIATDNQFEPVFIRFHVYDEDRGELPLDIARETLKPASNGKNNWLSKLLPEDKSLWRILKMRQIEQTQKKGFLLIFDQFEEIFSFPSIAIEALAKDLSEIFFTEIPRRYRATIEAELANDPDFLEEHELLKLHEPIALRVIIAIRSDRMSLLHQIKPFLPQILEHCYELRALSREQAEDAVLNPAFDHKPYKTIPFDYTDEALDYLLDFLSSNGRHDIESFQLQILCEYLEKNIVEKQGRNLIEPDDLKNPAGILETYYADKISEISDPVEHLAARRLIEEGLVFEEEERRLTLFEGQIQRNWGISADLLLHLENTHLIRREPSFKGGYTYELSHDTLVLPVLKAKAKRLEYDRHLKAEKEELRRIAELNELRERAEKDRMRAEREIIMRKEAQQIQKRVEDILGKIYFYKDRYGLAFDKKNNLYGFIDRQLNTAINFAYKEALPFDNTGFARVKKANKYFLVDVLGSEYLLASSLEKYSVDKIAADLRNNEMSNIPSLVINEQIKVLLLDNNCLNHLPKEIVRMINLVSLSLSMNQLAELPNEVGKLEKLRTLRLNSNMLKNLPLEITNLTNLETLHLSDNQLRSLPPQMECFRCLETLDVSVNQLENLPIEIGRLTNLKSLNLCENKLDELPESIEGLINLNSLNLSDNYITSIPWQVRNLQNLEFLDLSFNKLASLPDEIFELRKLKNLNLHKNHIAMMEIERVIEKMPWCSVGY